MDLGNRESSLFLELPTWGMRLTNRKQRLRFIRGGTQPLRILFWLACRLANGPSEPKAVQLTRPKS